MCVYVCVYTCIYMLSCPANFLSLNWFISKAFDYVVVKYHVAVYVNYISIINVIQNKNRDYGMIRKMRYTLKNVASLTV